MQGLLSQKLFHQNILAQKFSFPKTLFYKKFFTKIFKQNVTSQTMRYKISQLRFFPTKLKNSNLFDLKFDKLCS